MTRITNDSDFLQAIESLDYAQQRVVAGLFVNNVIGSCDDERSARVADTATNPTASGDKLATALKPARTGMQIDAVDVSASDESSQQYKILSDYLNS